MKLIISHSYKEHISASEEAERLHQDKTRSRLSASTVRHTLSDIGADVVVSEERKYGGHSSGHHYGGGHSTDVTTLITVVSVATSSAVAIIRALRPMVIAFIQEVGRRTVVIESDGQRVTVTGKADYDVIEALLERKQKEKETEA